MDNAKQHCWRVYFTQMERGYVRNNFKRVVAPDIETAIAMTKAIATGYMMLSSITHDGPVDAVYSAGKGGE
jgi:hypothetical protein